MGGMGAGFYFQIWVSKYGVKKKFSDPNMGFRVWVPKKKPRDREKYIVTTIYWRFIFIVSLQYLFIVNQNIYCSNIYWNATQQ